MASADAGEPEDPDISKADRGGGVVIGVDTRAARRRSIAAEHCRGCAVATDALGSPFASASVSLQGCAAWEEKLYIKNKRRSLQAGVPAYGCAYAASSASLRRWKWGTTLRHVGSSTCKHGHFLTTNIVFLWAVTHRRSLPAVERFRILWQLRSPPASRQRRLSTTAHGRWTSQHTSRGDCCIRDLTTYCGSRCRESHRRLIGASRPQRVAGGCDAASCRRGSAGVQR